MNFLKKYQTEQEFLIVRISEEKSIANLSTQIKLSSSSRIGEGDNINIVFEGSNIGRNEAIINELIEISHDKTNI